MCLAWAYERGPWGTSIFPETSSKALQVNMPSLTIRSISCKWLHHTKEAFWNFLDRIVSHSCYLTGFLLWGKSSQSGPVTNLVFLQKYATACKEKINDPTGCEISHHLHSCFFFSKAKNIFKKILTTSEKVIQVELQRGSWCARLHTVAVRRGEKPPRWYHMAFLHLFCSYGI